MEVTIQNVSYELGEPLGRPGKTGQAFLAKRLSDGETVVIKEARDKAFREIYRFEAEVLQQWMSAGNGRSFHYAPLLYGCDVDTFPYRIVMERAEGVQMSQLSAEAVESLGTAREAVVTAVAVMMYDMILMLHRQVGQGYQFTDLKSDNVFWNHRTKSIMVIDWNVLAPLSDMRRVNPMAAKQAEAEDTSALGPLIYQWATGVSLAGGRAYAAEELARTGGPGWLSLSRSMQKALGAALGGGHPNQDRAAELKEVFERVAALWWITKSELEEQVRERAKTLLVQPAQGGNALDVNALDDLKDLCSVLERRGGVVQLDGVGSVTERSVAQFEEQIRVGSSLRSKHLAAAQTREAAVSYERAVAENKLESAIGMARRAGLPDRQQPLLLEAFYRRSMAEAQIAATQPAASSSCYEQALRHLEALNLIDPAWASELKRLAGDPAIRLDELREADRLAKARHSLENALAPGTSASTVVAGLRTALNEGVESATIVDAAGRWMLAALQRKDVAGAHTVAEAGVALPQLRDLTTRFLLPVKALVECRADAWAVAGSDPTSLRRRLASFQRAWLAISAANEGDEFRKVLGDLFQDSLQPLLDIVPSLSTENLAAVADRARTWGDFGAELTKRATEPAVARLADREVHVREQEQKLQSRREQLDAESVELEQTKRSIQDQVVRLNQLDADRADLERHSEKLGVYRADLERKADELAKKENEVRMLENQYRPWRQEVEAREAELDKQRTDLIGSKLVLAAQIALLVLSLVVLGLFARNVLTESGSSSPTANRPTPARTVTRTGPGQPTATPDPVLLSIQIGVDSLRTDLSILQTSVEGIDKQVEELRSAQASPESTPVPDEAVQQLDNKVTELLQLIPTLIGRLPTSAVSAVDTPTLTPTSDVASADAAVPLTEPNADQ